MSYTWAEAGDANGVGIRLHPCKIAAQGFAGCLLLRLSAVCSGMVSHLPVAISFLTLNAVLADADFPIPAAARHHHFTEVRRRRCWRHCGGVRE